MLAIPGTDERLWFREPSVFLHDRFLAKTHHKEDAVTLQVGSMEMRDMMLEAEPKLFYIIDHYRNFPMLLVRLSALTPTILKKLMLETLAETDAKLAKKREKEEAKAKRAAERVSLTRGTENR